MCLVFTTTGDIRPETVSEALFAIFTMICGYLFVAATVAIMVTIISALTFLEGQHNHRLGLVKSYLQGTLDFFFFFCMLKQFILKKKKVSRGFVLFK